MKVLFRIFVFGFLAINVFAQDGEIGRETITPIEFPKFSVAGEYATLRNARFLGEDNISSSLEGNFGTVVSFDVGLAKYFNAGAGFSGSIGNVMEKESAFLRFFMFAKPVFPIYERVSIFARLSAGASVMIFSPLRLFEEKAEPRVRQQIKRVYDAQQYTEMSPGLNGGATVGVEFFPFSRFGFAFEWGIRTDFIYLRKSNLLDRLLKQDSENPNAPNSIKYLGIDMPLTLTLHIIL